MSDTATVRTSRFTGGRWLALTILLSACAATPFKPVDTPAALRVPDGEKFGFAVAARGVQIYECKAAAAGAPTAAAWSFVAPEAELFDAKGVRVGSHGAGPTWELPDGSKLKGTVAARADAPAAGAIPWLRLTTQSIGSAGRLEKVASIQRVNTGAGVAPATGCAVATDIGSTARVPYTADYYFFDR